jgi:hypothetical protein
MGGQRAARKSGFFVFINSTLSEWGGYLVNVSKSSEWKSKPHLSGWYWIYCERFDALSPYVVLYNNDSKYVNVNGSILNISLIEKWQIIKAPKVSNILG